MKTALLLALIAFCMAGCSSLVSVRESVSSITLPQGLTEQDAKAAMIHAVSQQALPEGTNWERMIDSVFSSRMIGYKSQFSRGNGWFVEAIETDAVVYGHFDSPEYIRVRLTVSGGTIQTKLDAAENIDHKGERIDEDAIEVIQELVVRVRATLGQFSRMKAGYAAH